MIRKYKRCTVAGTKTDLENGRKTSCRETVIYMEGQDPLRLAMLRNPELLGCNRYRITTPEDAFYMHVRQEYNTMQLEEDMKTYGYKDMRNKWSDPEYRW